MEDSPKPVYTPEGLQWAALRLLVALGIDAAIFAAALFLGGLGRNAQPTRFYEIGFIAVMLTSLIGFAITLLLVLTVIAWVMVAVSRRRD